MFLPFLNWQLGCAAMHAHELDACMGEDGGGVAFRSRLFFTFEPCHICSQLCFGFDLINNSFVMP